MSRELTRQEKAAIRSLVKRWCANYDKDVGCLPLDTPCYMSDLSKIADYIAFLHEGRLLFFESKDELIYHYGLIHCGEKLFREIDRGDILAWRKQDYEYQILVADREAAARKYKGCVIDPATLDDIMLLYIKGGSL